MRILWICNIMLPVIAEHLHREASNKEGWLTGLLDVLLKRKETNGIVLGVAFPAEKELGEFKEEIALGDDGSEGEGGKLIAYGFQEDTGSAERYDPALELRMKDIFEDFGPDVVHCFGTEYGHALAAARVCEKMERWNFLVTLQGLCAVCAQAYMADLPEKVCNEVTFRDWLRQDSIRQQQAKFAMRGEREKEVIGLAANVMGRTAFDRYYTALWNPGAKYYALNETLRETFYQGDWPAEGYEPHRIFLSQGDYPLKGLHYMLRALPLIKEKYPDAKVAVAGNSLVAYESLKDKLKLSAYGKYLRSLIRENGLADGVTFLGRLTAEEMKEQYLHSGVYVCCSTMENSPNSLGEAMLLGMPCVAADVGGIPSLFEDGRDGLLYRGFRSPEILFYGDKFESKLSDHSLVQSHGQVHDVQGYKDETMDGPGGNGKYGPGSGSGDDLETRREGAGTLGDAAVEGTRALGDAAVGGTRALGDAAVDGTRALGDAAVDGTGTSGDAAVEGAGTSGDAAVRKGLDEEGQIAGRLAEAVLAIFDREEQSRLYGRNAREHARATHHRENNYRRLLEIYREIAGNV